MEISEIIDLAKENQKCSQNDLARRMGITSSALSQIRKGGAVSDDNLTKLAKLAGLKPEIVHAAYHLAKPMSAETRNMWRRIGGMAAGFFGVMVASGALLPLSSAQQYILW